MKVFIVKHWKTHGIIETTGAPIDYVGNMQTLNSESNLECINNMIFKRGQWFRSFEEAREWVMNRANKNTSRFQKRIDEIMGKATQVHIC